MSKVECTVPRRDGCYGVYDNRMCYDCVHNTASTAKVRADNYADTAGKVRVLYEFLQGEGLPKGVECPTPKLSSKMAFNIIWFLQEVMGLLPDTIERCDGCGELYDSDEAGCQLDDQYTLNGRPLPKKYWGHWCDSCIPQVDWKGPAER